MNWYIGQPIVAISTHPHGHFKKGEEFEIYGLSKSECKCGTILIDIGIVDTIRNTGLFDCGSCGRKDIPYTGKIGFTEKRFAPLDVNISELTEILEREITNHE